MNRPSADTRCTMTLNLHCSKESRRLSDVNEKTGVQLKCVFGVSPRCDSEGVGLCEAVGCIFRNSIKSSEDEFHVSMVSVTETSSSEVSMA